MSYSRSELIAMFRKDTEGMKVVAFRTDEGYLFVAGSYRMSLSVNRRYNWVEVNQRGMEAAMSSPKKHRCRQTDRAVFV